MKIYIKKSDCRIFKSIISPEQINETALFFACFTNLQKLKVKSNIFDWAWSKMGVVNLVSGL